MFSCDYLHQTQRRFEKKRKERMKNISQTETHRNKGKEEDENRIRRERKKTSKNTKLTKKNIIKGKCCKEKGDSSVSNVKKGIIYAFYYSTLGLK